MANDRRADHQYSVNRPPDAKRPTLSLTSVGRACYAADGQMLQPVPDTRRGTPTPPLRHPSPSRPAGACNVSGGSDAPGAPQPIFHIQLSGFNDVIPVHIPTPPAGLPPRPAGHGASAAYLIHTGITMPVVSNVITMPVTMQRRTPSPKAVTARTVVGPGDLVVVNNQRGLSPETVEATAPAVMVTSRTPASDASLSQSATVLVAPPDASGRNSASPRSTQVLSSTGSSSSVASIPQLLITPAQAQLLGVAGSKFGSMQALTAQKLATQLELSKAQQQVLQGPVASTVTTNAMSQKVLISSVASSSEHLAAVPADNNGQSRLQSVPSAGYHHPSQVASADQSTLLRQPATLYPTNSALTATKVVVSSYSSIPQALKSQGALAAIRRLPVNTEPQRFFATNTPTVVNSASDGWTTCNRSQLPASHPNLPISNSTAKSSNLRQSHKLTLPGTTVAPRTHILVPNGIDLATANGDAHSSMHLDPLRRTPSPTPPGAAQGLGRQQTFMLEQSQLATYRQHIPNNSDEPDRGHVIHKHIGKAHSDLPRSLLNHSGDNKAALMPRLTPEKFMPPLISGSLADCPQSGGIKLGETVKLGETTFERLTAPFNMRVQNLHNFPATQQTSYRANNRSQAFAIHRAKTGSITNAAKSLDLLRQNLQKHINQEIDLIIQRYMMYFKPGIRNIRTNNGDSTVTDDHVSAVCRQILEEAKKMYGDATQSARPGEAVQPDTNVRSHSPSSSSLHENQDVRAKKMNLFNIPKRRGSSDSDVSIQQPKKKKKGRPPLYISGSGRSTPSKPGKAQEQVKREGPKWDPERLQETTKFVMGAKANKAMGLGNTRGRLYIKHPDIFKYSGDQDDKQWLFEHQHMPATGGKAYMLLEEDILELSLTDEYRDNPGLQLDDIQGFVVPLWLIDKMKKQMQAMRSDLPKVTKGQRSRSTTPTPTTQESVALDSDPPLPFSTMSDNPSQERALSPSPMETTLDMLVTDSEDVELQDVSPYNMAVSFVTLSPGTASISPAPSDLDGMDDDTTPFGTND